MTTGDGSDVFISHRTPGAAEGRRGARTVSLDNLNQKCDILAIGFPYSSDGKESACKAGDLGSILGQEDPLEKEMAIQSWRIP